MNISLISVIMGVYNCKDLELLKQSVQSIINQTYQNWEFIICNDGSTDDTLESLKTISKMDQRIRILSYKENVGLNYALNTCIAAANGEFLARQDDDDISEPLRFEKQVAFLIEHNDYDIVGTTAKIYDNKGYWGDYLVPQFPCVKDFFWNSPFIHPSTMIRSSSISKAGGYRVAKETRRCEDYDLFMRMYSMGMKGYNIQEQLYCYRMINDPNKTYRPMKYRVDEAKVRYIGFKNMGGKLLCLKTLPYIFKPIIIGCIPSQIFSIIRRKQY